MEDTNASQHDFQNNDEIWKTPVQKRHEHYSSNTESDYCQVRLDFIELVIHPNRPIVDLRSRIIQIKSTFQVYII